MILVSSRVPCAADARATSLYETKRPQPLSAETFVIAAVSVVLPWSTWPIVPTLEWGLLRLNFSLAMGRPQWLSPRALGCTVEAPRELASARSRVCVRAGNQRVRGDVRPGAKLERSREIAPPSSRSAMSTTAAWMRFRYGPRQNCGRTLCAYVGMREEDCKGLI